MLPVDQWGGKNLKCRYQNLKPKLEFENNFIIETIKNGRKNLKFKVILMENSKKKKRP